MSETQKALVVFEEKQPWKLVNDWRIDTPGPHEVSVKIIAAALNPVDWYVQAYGAPFVSYPFIGGMDGAGVVETVGSQVTNVAKGDRVLFPGGFEPLRATFKQYTVVPADNTAKIPENISFDQAASVPLCLATVAAGIWSHHPEASSVELPAPWEKDALKHAGQAALVLGGAASVGQYAIQLAKLSGFSPIITTASLHNESYLKSIGATHVVDRSLPSAEVLRQLPKLTGGKPIVYAYDTVAHKETQHLAYDALARGGALVVSHPQSDLLADKVQEGDGKRVAKPFASLQLTGNKELGVELYKHLTEWLETGAIVPNRVEVIPGGLAGITEGLDRLKNQKVSGTKLIVNPQDTP